MQLTNKSSSPYAHQRLSACLSSWITAHQQLNPKTYTNPATALSCWLHCELRDYSFWINVWCAVRSLNDGRTAAQALVHPLQTRLLKHTPGCSAWAHPCHPSCTSCIRFKTTILAEKIIFLKMDQPIKPWPLRSALRAQLFRPTSHQDARRTSINTLFCIDLHVVELTSPCMFITSTWTN